MEKINLKNVPQLSIQEMVILPTDMLLELLDEAEKLLQSAIKKRSWINGAIAIKELREKKQRMEESNGQSNKQATNYL